MEDREGLCSTQVEPSSTQENQANGATNAPSQEQVLNPPPSYQVTMQAPSTPIIDASQDQGQYQPSSTHVEAPHVEATQVD